MIFQRATRITDTNAKICAVKSIALVVLESLVNHETVKLAATKSGERRNNWTRVYHQWRYSFMKLKKYHKKSTAVRTKVTTPMNTTPHLIGKQRQYVYPWVNSLAQTQSQQQHSSKTGSAYGSSSVWASLLGFSLYGFSLLGFSLGGFSPAAASPSPPSRSESYSLYFLFFLYNRDIIYLITVNY